MAIYSRNNPLLMAQSNGSVILNVVFFLWRGNQDQLLEFPNWLEQ